MSCADEGLTDMLRVNLTRLISYARSADPQLQRQVAEKLANEAVQPSRQAQIVALGGLKLLLPLAQSTDVEVQRLAVHALANLSVNGRAFVNFTSYHHCSDPAENQTLMAEEGGIEALVAILDTHHINLQRQGAKALANLGVNTHNKELISRAKGIPPLIRLAGSKNTSVAVEAIAALANLAVNGEEPPKKVLRD
ncbi:unnamed protein product [Choristocarpus tenellus]